MLSLSQQCLSYWNIAGEVLSAETEKQPLYVVLGKPDLQWCVHSGQEGGTGRDEEKS